MCPEVTSTAATLAAAYDLGERESTAAVNLFRHTPRIVADTLFELSRTLYLLTHFPCAQNQNLLILQQHGSLARKYSMHRVIQHDALAAGILNFNYTGGTAQYDTWKDELSNTDELLKLISERMESDYESINPKMRKPIALRDLDTWMKLEQEQHQY